MKRMLTIGAGAAVGALLFAGGAAAQSTDAVDLRARQLEVFEDLLTRTVQEHVQSSIQAGVEAELTGDLDGDGEPDGPASDPVVVKVGDAASAHGLYIAGYGVLFSIQQPQISVLPRSFAIYLNQPRLRVRTRPEGESSEGFVRLQTVMIERQLQQAARLLEIQVQRDPRSETVAQLRAQIESMQRSLAAMSGATVHVGSSEEAEGAAEEAEPEATVELEGQFFELRQPMAFYREMADRRRSMDEVLRVNYTRMRTAVNTAAIDTLAHYGAVIKGLDGDDRLSVLVLPPNPWDAARRHADSGMASDEYVISVRYRDIRDFDDQKIDLEEFRKRVRIHDRLGLEIVHEEN